MKKVAEFQDRAELARRLAESAKTQDERDSLLSIAELWLKLAADRKAELDRAR